jgi:hypothetical protein
LFARTRGIPWVYRNRGPLRIAVVAIACLAYVFWDYPTGKVALLLAVLVVLAFAAIELIAGRGNGAGTPDDLGEATG